MILRDYTQLCYSWSAGGQVGQGLDGGGVFGNYGQVLCCLRLCDGGQGEQGYSLVNRQLITPGAEDGYWSISFKSG